MPGAGRSTETAKGRTVLIVGFLLLAALVYALRLETRLPGRLHVFYDSYFSDIFIPFYMYFVMCLSERRVRRLRDWRVKALLVFGIASLVEVLQGFGVPLLGRTFDPLDFVMFGIGTLLAVLADRLVLERHFPRRPLGEAQR